jgi:predicted kinase
VSRAKVGTADSRLIVMRGNSASGKSTVARTAQLRAGAAVAVVAQDYLRRIVLRERERAGGVNVGLIDSVARHCLDNGYDVIVEGILAVERYAEMLSGLRDDHRGTTIAYYLDVDLEETCRRHADRPQAADFTVDDMRSWYLHHDVLGWTDERVVAQSDSLDQTVARLLQDLAAGRSL